MYENTTFKVILNRMLDAVPATYDKREGSVIYNALAPAAAEAQLIYLELDRIIRESFADTQTRTYLIRRSAERGISPKEASAAIRKGEFNIDIPLGSRFSISGLNFSAFEKISTGIFKLSCEKTGAIGNSCAGNLIPLERIDGLSSAVMTDVIIPGEDEESTESLRKRYIENLDSQAFGGNIADYKSKVGSMQGVGGVKVIPTWNGAGTVKVIILGSNFEPPSSDLINTIQEAIDPKSNSGAGAGLAPIGHTCTVVGAESLTVNISTTITYQSGWTWPDVKNYAEKAMDEYFSSLSASWSNTKNIVVRLSQIETRLLDLPGVVDITDTTINSSTANLTLESNKIPLRGTINATTAN